MKKRQNSSFLRWHNERFDCARELTNSTLTNHNCGSDDDGGYEANEKHYTFWDHIRCRLGKKILELFFSLWVDTRSKQQRDKLEWKKNVVLVFPLLTYFFLYSVLCCFSSPQTSLLRWWFASCNKTTGTRKKRQWKNTEERTDSFRPQWLVSRC